MVSPILKNTLQSRKIPYSLSFASKDQLRNLHEISLDILATQGALFEHTLAEELLLGAGGVKQANGQITLSKSMVSKAIASAPSSIMLYDRNGQPSLHLNRENVYCGTGSDCPNIIDSVTGERRKTVKNDIELLTRISDALPNLDFVLSMGIASDQSQATLDLHHFHAMVTQTTKPIGFTILEKGNLTHILEMASIVAGSKKNLGDLPFIFHFAMPSPPFTHSEIALENIMQCAREKIPVVYASGTQIGATGPMSITGSAIASNIDVLAGLVVHQLVNPGSPFIYGVCVAPLDMKTTIEAYGAPEHYIGDALNTELANYYDLPTWGYAGSTDAKILDSQAALEYYGQTYTGMVSHTNLLHDCGYLEAGLTASCESLVFANEVIELVRRSLQPLDFSLEAMGVDLIRTMQPKHTYLKARHTLRHFRDFYYSELLDRQHYDDWKLKGALSMEDRVKIKTARIMETYHPQSLTADIFDALENYIADVEKKQKT